MICNATSRRRFVLCDRRARANPATARRFVFVTGEADEKKFLHFANTVAARFCTSRSRWKPPAEIERVLR